MNILYVGLAVVAALVVIAIYSDKMQVWIEKIITRLEKVEDYLDSEKKPITSVLDQDEPAVSQPVSDEGKPASSESVVDENKPASREPVSNEEQPALSEPAQFQTKTRPDDTPKKAPAFDYDAAVKEFHAAGLLPMPDEESINTVVDDWGLEDTEDDYAEDLFIRLFIEQPRALSFEAYKPGKYVSYLEIVEFVFNNAGDSIRASDIVETRNEEKAVRKVSWTAAGQQFSYPCTTAYVGEIEVEWIVGVVNDALSTLESPLRCVIGHFLDDHIVLLVADETVLVPLMERYSLSPEVVRLP